jgi:hypothetical protein
MPFDPQRYRQEVLDPARAAHNRPPSDLVARYQLPEPLTPAGVREAVAAVRAFWRTQRATLAYKRVVAALEADDRHLTGLLDAAAGGDLAPLRDEIGRRRAEASHLVETLAAQLTALADPLQLLSPAVVGQVVAEGHPREQVERQLRELKIAVRVPDPLAPDAPVRGSRPLQQALQALGCRHIADFLFGRDALADGFSVFDGFSVSGEAALGLDQTVVSEQSRRWQTRLHGKTEPENVLTVLRPLSADQLRDLLVWECAADLRHQRSALHAGPGVLLERARRLGLAEPDARRLAFAVQNEHAGQPRSPLAEQLHQLLDERRVVEAHRMVDGLPEARLPDDARELADHATAQATRALALRDRARGAGDPDTTWQLLDQAESIAADLPELAELRERCPPQPPGGPQIQVEPSEVVITWPASPSRAGPVRYQVLRADRPFPAGPVAARRLTGTRIAETGELVVRDRAAPANTPLHYAVIAERGGVPAAPVTAGPAWYRPEISDLRVTPGEGVVLAAWRTPPEASEVLVWRAEGRPPRGPADGKPVPLTGGGFADQQVRPGVTYHYLLVTGYPGPDGQPVLTPGVRRTATPARPPEPVAELRLEPVADGPGWLTATYPPPRAGTVELRLLSEAPEHPPGTRLPVAALPGQPVPAVPVPGGLKVAAPPPPAVLLVVTVNGDQAVLGAHREWRALPAPVGVRAHRRGDEILLTWHWPAGLGEIVVRWRPAGDSDLPWRTELVSAARYQTGGGVRLALGEHRYARYEVSVAAVVRSGGEQLTGPAAMVTVDLPAVAWYTVSWRGLRHRQLELAVRADRSVQVSQLLLIADRELPLTPESGEVVAVAQDLRLSPRPIVIRADPPRRTDRYWLRCFTRGGAVELRDPPRSQLRRRSRWPA